MRGGQCLPRRRIHSTNNYIVKFSLLLLLHSFLRFVTDDFGIIFLSSIRIGIKHIDRKFKWEEWVDLGSSDEVFFLFAFVMIFFVWWVHLLAFACCVSLFTVLAG